ncbi:MAG TPA: carboxyl transferase domain-containing protein [Acidimicrobiales bacterium]|nr:carboxyl transferase domain-containing protein [Acidimicrobiales bacterium]
MTAEVRSPLQGTVVSCVAAGATVAAGTAVAVIESMKMEHVITAPSAGRVGRLVVAAGDHVDKGALIAEIDEKADTDRVVAVAVAPAEHTDEIRPDLAEVVARHEVGLDAARPDAVERRRGKGRRTIRENVDDLLDPGSFIEYGPTVVAAQRRRRSMDDLIARTPADGLVGGLGTVDGQQIVVVAYDETVLAGTQGLQNHRKKDRLFEIAAEQRLPVVLFAEGGGGRPGDTDGVGGSGLDTMAFRLWGELSGLVPLVGINAGYCFAGNAALLGCCDVVIATEDSNLGMGGPAMIEGGGLGVVEPTEVGPIEVQRANGVVDVVVGDEAEAVAVAKRYLATFAPRPTEWTAPDQTLLRESIPENRLRVYDVRAVIDTLCDTDSVLELRRDFGLGMVTAIARIEGRSVGVIANNPTHLAGAIDSDGADKAARFLELCDAFDVPVVFLCDTPGIMVGPEVEKTALVRHAARLFVTAGSIDIAFVTVVLRKGYGLGAMTMAGGSFKTPIFTVAWPTGEFGGMGLEGAVRLGYRKELEAIDDPTEREAAFEEMVERMYQYGKALNTATTFEIDDVIDPADTRRWITRAFDAAPPPPHRTGKKRPGISPW